MKRLLLSSLLVPFVGVYLFLNFFNPGLKADQTQFLEENDLNISVNDRNISEVTEEIFNQVLDRLYDIYAPIVVENLGRRFYIDRNWESGLVNAYARRSGIYSIISMYGGLARHITMTPDGFALVACHEIGHHLGGLPRKPPWNPMAPPHWSSVEGQADYYGTLKCLRKYFALDNNVEVINDMEVDPYVVERCAEIFTEDEDQAICQRSAMAGLSTANLSRAIFGGPVIDFQTPDPNFVDETSSSQSSAQCRLDIYLAGALCDKDASIDVSGTDINQGVCSRVEGYSVGVRPMCWYRPGRGKDPEVWLTMDDAALKVIQNSFANMIMYKRSYKELTMVKVKESIIPE